jgi:16S rRNA (adenine1518-N6/adenine1519-N6)-dimethyltransferase
LAFLRAPRLPNLEHAAFEGLVRAAFSQRRKTVLNSLSNYSGLSKEELSKLLLSAGIAPVRRAETISLTEFAELFRGYQARQAVKD